MLKEAERGIYTSTLGMLIGVIEEARERATWTFRVQIFEREGGQTLCMVFCLILEESTGMIHTAAYF
jgi:hypothetical protein